MSDSSINDQPVQEAEQQPVEVKPELSPGAQLAARRQELGLTIERVAEQLKMTPRKVLAIEADDHAAVHGKPIFRGFVRAYAKILRMDSDPLIAMILDDAPSTKKVAPAKRNVSQAFSETRMPVLGQRNHSSKWVVVAIILIVLLIGVLAAQKMGWIPAFSNSMSLQRNGGASASVTLTPVNASVEPAKEAKADVSAPVSASGDEKIKQIDLPPVDVSSQLASAPAAATAPVDSANAAPENATVPQTVSSDASNALVLKCREESWVELRRANGSVLASRRIPAGGSETFTISEPVQLTLGNGPGVDALLRGAPLEIPSDANSKVVRLSLK